MKLGVDLRSSQGWTSIKKENGYSLGFVYIICSVVFNFLPWSDMFVFFTFSTVVVSYKLFICLRSSNSICEQCVFPFSWYSFFIFLFVPLKNNSLNHLWRCLVLGFLAGIQAKKTKKTSPVVTWRSRVGAVFFSVGWGGITKYNLGGGFKDFLFSPPTWGRFPI